MLFQGASSSELWSTITSCARYRLSASSSVLAVSLPGRMRTCGMMMFDWLANEISPPMNPMPPPGAVWPAMVRLLLAETAVSSWM